MKKLNKAIRSGKELKDNEANKIIGGAALGAGTYAYTVYIHDNCGGEIENVRIFWASCECSKCHETHYWLSDFKYHKEYTD